MDVDQAPLGADTDFQQRSASRGVTAGAPWDPCLTNITETRALNPILIKIGVPFDLTVSCQGWVNLVTTPGGTASADSGLGNTITCLGLAGVALTNQTMLSNSTFVSLSGFNYGVKLQLTNRPPPVLNPGLSTPKELNLCWSSVPYQLYRLESCPALTDNPDWQPSGPWLGGDGSQVCVSATPTEAARFFRLAALANP